MKPIYVKICLFDPATQEKFPIVDGVEVDIVEVEVDRSTRSAEYSGEPLKLTSCSEKKEIFHVNATEYRVTSKYHIRVRFLKLNFSKQMRKLLAPDEINPDSLPIYHPSRLPYWDTGWNDGYRKNVYFSSKDFRRDTTIEHPLILEIPIRRIFNIGHRGAPHWHPENTIASFDKALDLKANGLELDLCMTKDKKIVVFHDPKAVDLVSLNRSYVENFPFGLVSPEIVIEHDGVYAITKKWDRTSGQYVVFEKKCLNTMHEYDIINLTLEEVAKTYRYHCDSQGGEEPIPTFEEFLEFASKEYQGTNRLQFLYFDVKNPGWDEKKDRELFVEFGSVIGKTLNNFQTLPAKLILGCTKSNMLQNLKKGIEKTGENRCEFAYDAQGSPTHWLETIKKDVLDSLISHALNVPKRITSFLLTCLRFFKRLLLRKSNNPLEETKAMGNKAVSIGCLGKDMRLEEIKPAVYDRDFNSSTSLKSIIHYTLNTSEQMYQSMATGVNGVVTDKPDEFEQLLNKLGVIISCPE